MSPELMPFFAFVIRKIAANYFSNGSGLSSIIVPTFTENRFLHSLQCHVLRVAMKDNRSQAQ